MVRIGVFGSPGFRRYDLLAKRLEQCRARFGAITVLTRRDTIRGSRGGVEAQPGEGAETMAAYWALKQKVIFNLYEPTDPGDPDNLRIAAELIAGLCDRLLIFLCDAENREGCYDILHIAADQEIQTTIVTEDGRNWKFKDGSMEPLGGP